MASDPFCSVLLLWSRYYATVPWGKQKPNKSSLSRFTAQGAVSDVSVYLLVDDSDP
jgi:hypothetical protein